MELTSIRTLWRDMDSVDLNSVTVGGWVRSIRDSKTFGFITLADGTFFEPVQVVYDNNLPNFAEICKFNVGSAIVVKGRVILTPEAKSIPIAYEMARQSGKPYIVARKGVKVYMRNPLEVTVTSITTQKEQKLYLGETEVNLIKGKRVLIVDDVISTGESLSSVRELVKKAGATEAAACAILAEGDAAERDDIIFLEKLPLFFK